MVLHVSERPSFSQLNNIPFIGGQLGCIHLVATVNAAAEYDV